MLENLQGSERYEKIEAAVDLLNDASECIDSAIEKISVSLDLGYTASQKSENYSKQIKFVKAIDAKLQEKGVKEPMYIQLSGTANYYAIDSRRIAGRVMWRPMIGTFALRATEAWR